MNVANIVKWVCIIIISSLFVCYVSKYINISNDFVKSILIGFLTAIIIILPLNRLGNYLIKSNK